MRRRGAGFPDAAGTPARGTAASLPIETTLPKVNRRIQRKNPTGFVRNSLWFFIRRHGAKIPAAIK